MSLTHSKTGKTRFSRNETHILFPADEKSSRNLCYNERCDDTMVGPPVWDNLSSCKRENRLHDSAQRPPTPVNTSYFETQSKLTYACFF